MLNSSYVELLQVFDIIKKKFSKTFLQEKEINCIYFVSRDIRLTLTRLGTLQFITGLKQYYLL